MSTIKIKRSSTPGAVPASLAEGEIAINDYDEVLFYRTSGGLVHSFALATAPVEMLAQLGLQINGSMELDREHSGAAVPITTGTISYVLDQWQFGYNHTANTAVFSANQAATGGAVPLGPNLGYGLRAVATTAFVSPNVNDWCMFRQPIEGLRVSRLAWGTSLARSISVGFWVYATVTGVASVVLRNGANNRSYVVNFTVAQANTWQFVTVNVPGDQAGTWLATTGVGLDLGFCFGCGTNFKTTNATWAAGNFVGTSSNTNFFANVNNQVIITGVVVLPGNSMPPAARMGLLIRPSDEELRLCMRYWEIGREWLKYNNQSPYYNNLTYGYDSIPFLVPKRVAPTMTLTGWQYYSGGTATNCTPAVGGVFTDHFEWTVGGLSNWSGWPNTGTWKANARL